MSTTTISLKYAYHYVFSTVPLTDINRGLYKAGVSLTHALFNTLVSLLSVAFYILIFVFKLLVMAFPHALNLAKIIVEFHRTQLSVSDIFLEVLVLTTILLFFLFRKRITKAWKDVEAYISKKSTAAAKAAPHILFFGSSLVLTIVGKKFIMPLTSNSVMPLFTLLIPIFTTTKLLYGSNSTTKNLSDLFNHKILLWVILAAYHSIVTMLSLIPFSNRLLYLLPIGKELVIVVLLWVQLSPAFTVIVFKSLVTPILKWVSKYLPTTDSFEAKVQQSNLLVRGLKMMRLINDAQEEFLRSLLQDSVASLMALVFILMPNPFASFGMVAVALLLPAFRTASTTSALIKAKITARSLESSKSGAGSTADKLPSIMMVHRQWLEYWLCIGLLWCVRIYGFALWPSTVMLCSLYLQHSYFKGASVCLSWLRVNGRMLVDRNAETQRQRQQEKQQQQQQQQLSGGGGGSASGVVSAEQRFEEEALDPNSVMSDVFISKKNSTPPRIIKPSTIAAAAAEPKAAAAVSAGVREGRKDYKELKLRLAAASMATTSRASTTAAAVAAATAAVVAAAEEQGPFSEKKESKEVYPDEDYVKVTLVSNGNTNSGGDVGITAVVNVNPAVDANANAGGGSVSSGDESPGDAHKKDD